jgi:hypothetical protein
MSISNINYYRVKLKVQLLVVYFVDGGMLDISTVKLVVSTRECCFIMHGKCRDLIKSTVENVHQLFSYVVLWKSNVVYSVYYILVSCSNGLTVNNTKNLLNQCKIALI